LSSPREARPIVPGEAVHVVGAGGAGASAAALLASAAGAVVTGCDAGGGSSYTAPLAARGIEVRQGHDPSHVAGLDPATSRLAVTKALTSIQPDHPELRAARRLGLPLEPWQQVVADAAKSHGGRLVAIAGTHGKSTSAGWLVHLLVAAGYDPAAFVGALLPAALTGGPPATARWGRGDAFIVEADEYAGNFDPYRPDLAVILNAEWDHPDVFADQLAVVEAFSAWLDAPGAQERRVVVNIEDPGGAELAERLEGRGAWLVRVGTQSSRGDVSHRLIGRRLVISGLPGLAGVTVETEVRLAGAHNAANAACVATAAALLGVGSSDIASGLETFGGVGRRLEVKGEPGGVLVIDDYGHHPTAIRATLAAVRDRYPGRPVWIAHEPLTFHRAAAMADELALALAAADHVVIAEIWAGRDPDTTITSAAALAEGVDRVRAGIAEAPGSVEATAENLAGRVRAGDVVLVMGGGRSSVIAERLVALLEERGGG
jgi:UDP-N-acetylmuramate--alanine ligase